MPQDPNNPNNLYLFHMLNSIIGHFRGYLKISKQTSATLTNSEKSLNVMAKYQVASNKVPKTNDMRCYETNTDTDVLNEVENK